MNYKKYQLICRTSSGFELGMKNYLNKTGSENQVESSGNSLIKVNVLLRHINQVLQLHYGI